MKRSHYLFVCAVMLLPVILKAEKYVVTGATLNVRNAPSTTGKIIGQLSKDMVINVEEISNDFASFDFMGQKGHVSTKFLKRVSDASGTLTPAKEIILDNQVNTPAEDNHTGNSKAEPDNVIQSASKKVGKEFSKLKDKVKGLKKDKKESISKNGEMANSDSLTSNFSRLQRKNVKFNVISTDSVYGYQTEIENFKDDEGYTKGFGFRVEEHRDGKTYYYIYQDYSSGSVPKGAKMLIRAADGTVGEIVAVNSGKSELYRYYDTGGLASSSHYAIDQSSFRIYYQAPLELIQAIQEYGIIKIRDIRSDEEVRDYTFSGKRFDKANEKSFQMLCRICGLYNNRENTTLYSRWKNSTPKKKEVPAF